MNQFDSQYYFVRQPKSNDTLPYLVPDRNTENRDFRYAPQHPSSPPLVFHNGWKDENISRGIKCAAPDIVFAGADLVVRTAIRDQLLQIDIPNLSLHPTIFIDDANQWHEDYWYMTFSAEFDCWDRKTSEYETDIPPVTVGNEALYQVYTYSLDQHLLESTPKNARLLFKMGGAIKAFVVCHDDLARLFRQGGKSGAVLTLVKDY